MLDRLAGLAIRRGRIVLWATVAFVVVAGGLGAPVAGLLSASGANFEDPDSEAVRASAQLHRAAGAGQDIGLIALVTLGGDVRGPAARERVGAIARELRADPAVARVAGFPGTGDPAFVSRDGRSTYLAVAFRSGDDAQNDAAVARIREQLAGAAGVTLGGPQLALEQVSEQIEGDLARAELLAFPILFLLSLLVFRGVVAALLPLVVGAVSIVGTFLALRVANEITPLSVFAVNLVTGLGLGLAIDYSLFIVSRYREELVRVGPGPEALRRTLATAGRTVLFSALTVAVALAGLLIFPLPFLYSMGLGGMLVALISAATALVVLPAILAALGPRVNALAPARWQRAVEQTARGEQRGFWYRLARAVMRRPIPIATATALALVVLGLPFLRAEFTGVDASVLPTTASARQVADTLEDRFPRARTSPVTVAITAPRSAAGAVGDYAGSLEGLPHVAAVARPQPLGGTVWKIDVTCDAAPLSDECQDLVRAIRGRDAPLEAAVTGQTAGFIDQQRSIVAHLPLALAILSVGTLVLLFGMTGSVILPLKTLIMNLVSLSATLGVLVLVFQDGRLEGLLDYESQGALESTQPVLLFIVAFALSTDYAMFLLGRIKEAHDAGLSNTDAVALGLERTGRIVTAAALLFSIALGAFSTSEIVFIKLLGVGAVVAVLLDSTIVRALLVPSLMRLLGDRNWWAPAPLRRLHARLGLREG